MDKTYFAIQMKDGTLYNGGRSACGPRLYIEREAAVGEVALGEEIVPVTLQCPDEKSA